MPAISIKRKEGEPAQSLVYRFTKKVKQSGVLVEAKSRRFRSRNVNRNKRRVSAIYRSERRKEIDKIKRGSRS